MERLLAESNPDNSCREAYAQPMFRTRTQADAIRRGMCLRVFNVALLLFACASAIFLCGVAFAIVAGALAALQIATLAFYFWLFRHADPALLAAPINPAVRMHWRYLRPNKYPYEAPVTSAERENHQKRLIDEEGSANTVGEKH